MPTAFSCQRQAAPKPKPKPQRRRKPQKPGKTAKMNERHFVIHNYHDHANDEDDEDSDQEKPARRGGVSVSFPLKLHEVLDQVETDGLAHIVSWQPHGRSFAIHKPKQFTEQVMPEYFRQTKLTSFQRQLNLYGFNRLTRGNDSGAHYHELFLRGKLFLCKQMARTKVKGTKYKAASSPDQEPNFYSMPRVIVTPNSSDCDNSSDDADRCHSTDHDIRPQSIAETDPCRPTTMTSSNVSPSNPWPQQQLVPEIAPPLAYCNSSESSPMASPQQILASHAVFQQTVGVLDDAVEELFLDEIQDGVSNDSVLDFVNIWDPFCYGPADAALTIDIQLGNLLDRLLED